VAYKCKLCRDFVGQPELYLCSTCKKRYEDMAARDRPDLDAFALKPYVIGGNDFADINEELRKMDPAVVNKLIDGHVARALPFTISIDEALTMQRVHRNVETLEDSVVLDGLVKRMDTFLEQNNFRDKDGNSCAFAKICDVSPKDVLGTAVDDILPRAHKYVANYTLEATNVNLQSLIYAKATHKPTFMEPGARGIIDLLCRSERCMESGLTRTGYPHNPQPVEITLHDWMCMDPAFELRCFVNKDRLRGISQMASMGIQGVHYPQLLARREEIRAGSLAFFQEIGPKLAPLSAGLSVPGRYVVDLYFDVSSGRWWVVELNPFMTSSLGHLFSEDYGERWMIWDALEDDPLDVRMSDFTSADVLKDPEMPESWRSHLESSADLYGPERRYKRRR